MRLLPVIEVHCDCPCCERIILITIEWGPLMSLDLDRALRDRGWDQLFPKHPVRGEPAQLDFCTDCGAHGPEKIRKEREK